jgi:hypothetical protein
MLYRVLFTGPAEDASSQKHAIYNEANRYPSGLTWEIQLDKMNVSKDEFFENLFFSTEKNGGNSYFTPMADKATTNCRFEWHRPWRNKAAQIRLGVVFDVDKGGEPKIGLGYFGTNEGYKSINALNYPSQLSTRKFNEFKDWIAAELVLANTPRSERNQESWNFIFYAKGSLAYWKQPFLVQNGTVLVLPPRLVDGATRTAIVIQEHGITKGDANRKAMRKLQLLLALLTLAMGDLWEIAPFEGGPDLLIGKLTVKKTETALVDKLFPTGSEDVSMARVVSRRTLSFVRYAISKLEAKSLQNDQFFSALFAYYGGLLASGKTPSLGTVGFTASLGLLASHLQEKCTGKLTCNKCGELKMQHNLVGDRAAISKMIALTMKRSFGQEIEQDRDFLNWVKDVYNSHRSQYVHSAKHQFNEFSQVFLGSSSKTTLVPTAIPYKQQLVGKEHEHRALIGKLPLVVRIVLIDKLSSDKVVSGVMKRLAVNAPDFTLKFDREAFMGMPTAGWVRTL